MSQESPPVFDDLRSQSSGRVFIDLQMISGASGAVPSTFTRKTGIVSVTRNSTGNYTAVLDRTYVDLFGLSGGVMQASYSATAAREVQLVSHAITNATTPSVTFTTVNSAGAVTDMSSGDTLFLTIEAQWIAVGG
jgi:hypothetical protein